jgi:hypothetical protein
MARVQETYTPGYSEAFLRLMRKRSARMFTMRQPNKYRALKQGTGQILRLVSLSNGCKQRMLVGPRIAKNSSLNNE